MGEFYIQLSVYINIIILIGICVFQVSLFFGLPLGEYSWGGQYKGVLPKKLRIGSIFSAFLLIIMAVVYLMRASVISNIFPPILTYVLAWIFTIFLGLNTLGNLASKSKKEKIVMTPLSAIAFLTSLLVNIVDKIQ